MMLMCRRRFDEEDRTAMKTLRNYLVMIAIALVSMLGISSPASAGGIHVAADKGDLVMVQLLLASDSSLADSRDDEGMTPLHYAALNGNGDLMHTLLANRASIDAKDGSGQTPLHMAVVFHNTRAVQILLDAGANVNAADSNGQTALHVAAMNGFKDIAQMLMVHGASIDARDAGGQTALHKAATFGQKDMVAMLLELNANVNATDDMEMSPTGMARINKFHDIVEILQKYGGKEMILVAGSLQ
jgi:ankyrin repeat protein